MAANDNADYSNIANIVQAMIDGSTDYPEFKDNPPSRIATLLMELGQELAYPDGTEVYY